jgi:UvrD/REP helicase N-terminal domain/PQQ-like domain
MQPDREFRLPRIARPIRIWSSAALLFTPLAVFGLPAHAADEWTTMNKDYSAQRYVDLDEITKENAGGLREVCEIELNQPVVFSSGLLMVGGTLYVLTNRQTVAFDAATCALRWRHVLDFKGPPVSAGGRGLGYLDGKVFRGAPDGRVMAFDANTGKVLWDVQAANPERQEMFPSAPIDLIMRPTLLIETDEAVRTAVRLRHCHVLVDEYQDVNRASARLLHGVAGDGHRLWVVGDARQSIRPRQGASPAPSRGTWPARRRSNADRGAAASLG